MQHDVMDDVGLEENLTSRSFVRRAGMGLNPEHQVKSITKQGRMHLYRRGTQY
jgi:hypothetical protein